MLIPIYFLYSRMFNTAVKPILSFSHVVSRSLGFWECRVCGGKVEGIGCQPLDRPSFLEETAPALSPFLTLRKAGDQSRGRSAAPRVQLLKAQFSPSSSGRYRLFPQDDSRPPTGGLFK